MTGLYLGRLWQVLLLCAAGSAAPAQDCQWAWAPVGASSAVGELQVLDDGSGLALYAGGVFSTIGGVYAPGLARFNGLEWSPIGEGITGYVNAMVAHDDGSGRALYFGGVIHSAGGVPIKNVAKWDGQAWSAVGDGINGEDGGVLALASVDGPDGATLYAAGYFTFAGGQYVHGMVKLVGNHWVEVPNAGGVYAMSIFDDGTGPALFAGGGFQKIGGKAIRAFAKWDGTAWSDPGAALSYPGDVRALLSRDEEGVSALYLGGSSDSAGDLTINGICRWDGKSWTALDMGLSAIGGANALAFFPGGMTDFLVAGGAFEEASGLPVKNIAAWDGRSWSAVGPGVDAPDSPWVVSLATFDFGGEPILFVGGYFQYAGGLYSPNLAMVRCIPVCKADCDGSGSLDLADFACFQGAFAAGDMKADCDASGALDLFDFLCFVNAFNAGCP